MQPRHPGPWYETGVLVPEIHERLVIGRQEYAQDAGIPEAFIWTPLSTICGQTEIAWVKRFQFHRQAGKAGLIYLGDGWKPSVDTRMAAIAGALLRNFVRARVMHVNQILPDLKDGVAPRATCLLLPTFCTGKSAHKAVEAWKTGMICELLSGRYNDGEVQTVIGAPSLEALAQEYGSWVEEHVSEHFVQVQS